MPRMCPYCSGHVRLWPGSHIKCPPGALLAGTEVYLVTPAPPYHLPGPSVTHTPSLPHTETSRNINHNDVSRTKYFTQIFPTNQANINWSLGASLS